MTSYPWAETGLRVALDLDGDGTYEEDITEYVKVDSGGVAVKIERGMQSEGSTAPTATASMVLRNGDQRFTRRNPESPYWGLLNGNTPIRVDVPHIVSRLVVPEDVEVGMYSTDTDALSIAGDLEVRIDVELPDWDSSNSGNGMTMIRASSASGYSWQFAHNGNGELALYWYDSGDYHLTATAPMPPGPKRQTLIVAMDVNNGAGGHDVSFYVADSLTGSQEQIGETVTGSGAATIHASATDLIIGDNAGGRERMKVYGAMILDAGSVVSTLDLTGEEGDVSSVEDTEGATWTVGTGARLETRDARYTGVVPSWEPAGGLISDDSEVSVVAYDELRRIGRTRSTDLSTYRRAVLAEDSEFEGLIGYVPMEDTHATDRLAVGVPGQDLGRLYGDTRLASDSTFPGSLPLPTFSADTKVFSYIPAYVDTGEWKVSIMLSVPSAGLSSTQRALRVRTDNYDLYEWSLYLTSAGHLQVVVKDADGGTTHSTAVWAFGVNGGAIRLGLSAEQSGSDVSFTFSTLPVGESIGSAVVDTIAGVTNGKMTQTAIAPDGGLADCVSGHMVQQSIAGGVYDAYRPFRAYNTEDVASRVRRIATELGVRHDVHGGSDLQLGYQPRGKSLDVLRVVELTDGGILYSPRDERGIAYRSRDSMCARAPVLSTTYSESGVRASRPAEGDRRTVNRLTVTRTGGAGLVVEDATGPMGTQDPPSGVGLYEGSVELNLRADDDLKRRGLWELLMGTIDAPRYPLLQFDLGSPPFALEDSPDVEGVKAAIRDLDIGDRFVQSSPPSWVSVDEIDQVTIGLAERIGPWVHEIDAVSMPYDPWDVGVYDAPGSSDDCYWSYPGELVSMSDSALVITSPVEWTHDDGDYVVTVEGEEVLVTGVSGSVPTFTLAITRSFNGVYKTHYAGEIVEIRDAFRWGV